MSRPSSEDRLRRILAVVPWVVANDGPLLADVCARFDYASEAELQDELNLLFMCGVPPYTPDSLIEVDVAEGRVWIRYADWFVRPLRLTAAEALTLVASSTALIGADMESPLARGLAKVAAALGVDEDAVDVTLGPTPDALDELRAAAASHHQLEIEYYAYGRDEVTTRVVDPYLVYSAAGQWYLAGYCHRACDERLFRVDRVRKVTTLGSTFPPPAAVEPPPIFAASPADPIVALELGPAAAWVASQYPTTSVEQLGDGRLRVELAVSGEAWLARLLLRIGPHGRVVRGDGSAGRRAARRILERYAAL